MRRLGVDVSGGVADRLRYGAVGYSFPTYSLTVGNGERGLVAGLVTDDW